MTAHKLAARIVGGDPSNDPIVHPIRWPGSWHRKGKPRLCEIETANPDREADLTDAFAKLRAVAPELKSPADEGSTDNKESVS